MWVGMCITLVVIIEIGWKREYPDVAQKDHPEDGPSTCVPYAQFSAYQNFGYQTWKIDQIPAELHYNHWIADRTMAFIDGLGADENFFCVVFFSGSAPSVCGLQAV